MTPFLIAVMENGNIVSGNLPNSTWINFLRKRLSGRTLICYIRTRVTKIFHGIRKVSERLPWLLPRSWVQILVLTDKWIVLEKRNYKMLINSKVWTCFWQLNLDIFKGFREWMFNVLEGCSRYLIFFLIFIRVFDIMLVLSLTL